MVATIPRLPLASRTSFVRMAGAGIEPATRGFSVRISYEANSLKICGCMTVA
jgi:hypothetical protein